MRHMMATATHIRKLMSIGIRVRHTVQHAVHGCLQKSNGNTPHRESITGIIRGATHGTRDKTTPISVIRIVAKVGAKLLSMMVIVNLHLSDYTRLVRRGWVRWIWSAMC